MNKEVCFLLLLGSAIACVFSAARQYSVGDQSKRREAEMSWSAPTMYEIESDYATLWHAYHNDRDKFPEADAKSLYVEMERLVDCLFRMRLSEQNLRQLAASCDALPIQPKERSRFEKYLLAFMVKAFVELGEGDSLVTPPDTRVACRDYTGHL